MKPKIDWDLTNGMPNSEILTFIGAEISHGQAQNGVNFDI